jgi:hypothetical protein
MTRTKLFDNDAIVTATVDLALEIERHVVKQYTSQLKTAIREDIMSELRGKLFADTMQNSDPLPESDPQPEPVQTGLHGEPLGSDDATPAPIYGRNHPKGNSEFWKDYQRPMSKKHHEMVSILSRGRFVALPTIAGLVKLKASTVQQYLYDLADHGFDIESQSVNVRYGKRGYRKIYRIASGA